MNDLHTLCVVILLLIVGVAEVKSYSRRVSMRKQSHAPAVRSRII